MADWKLSFYPKQAEKVLKGDYEAIGDAFSWCDTEEGDIFWNDFYRGNKDPAAFIRLFQMLEEFQEWEKDPSLTSVQPEQ